MNFLLSEYLIFPRPIIQFAISYQILPNICCTSATNFAVKISLMLSGDIQPNPGPVDFHSLGVCHANVRSLHAQTKLDELKHVADTANLDILTISESWLDESDENISIPGFQPIFRDDHKGDARGGGVAIFCGENVNSELCGELTSSELPPDCSNIWLKLYFENSTILLGTYYCPPGQSAQNRDLFLNCLSYSLTKAFELNATAILITGNFNDRCTEWHSDHSASDLGLRLYNLAERYGLLQLVKYPTRTTDTTSSLLDLILTDSPDLVEKVSILPPISTSDHSVVCCRIKLPITNFVPYRRTVWNFRNADFASLNNSLRQAPFDSGPM